MLKSSTRSKEPTFSCRIAISDTYTILNFYPEDRSYPADKHIHASFPVELKKAEVTPVFKKDDRMNKEKYRPVSVLPFVSKPYEYIMFDQLME